MDKSKKQNIVVFMPRYLGDCINCTPALEMLKGYYPDCTLHLVIREPSASIFDTMDRVECIHDPRPYEKLKGSFGLIKQLRTLTVSACVLMTNTFADALIAKLAGIPVSVGYKTEMRGGLLTQSLKLDRTRHYINRYAYLANLLCNNTYKKLPEVSIPFNAGNSVLYENKHSNIGICIASKAKLSRHYPVEQTMAVVVELANCYPHSQFLMLGTKEESTAAEYVVEMCREQGVGNITSLAGKTSVHELIDHIAALDLLITVDSGPLHVAAATKTPTIALHSKGTSPFSVVCPKQDSIYVVNSRGGYIDDNDQVLDLYPDDIITLAKTILGEPSPS